MGIGHPFLYPNVTVEGPPGSVAAPNIPCCAILP
jgi:hypothetical protein